MLMNTRLSEMQPGLRASMCTIRKAGVSRIIDFDIPTLFTFSLNPSSPFPTHPISTETTEWPNWMNHETFNLRNFLISNEFHHHCLFLIPHKKWSAFFHNYFSFPTIRLDGGALSMGTSVIRALVHTTTLWATKSNSILVDFLAFAMWHFFVHCCALWPESWYKN